jgi:DNA polymerase III delta prime subunit
MNESQPSFITKYKPYFIEDFDFDDTLLNVIKTLIDLDHLNLMFIGNASSGKTTLLYALIRNYYNLDKNAGFPENNILFINNLKEQGIHYFRNEMKTFCQTHSGIYGKKKLVIIDDIDSINEQSQQVFRNYIDKYKHNIHFISVCSNIQKVIESIQSRVHILQLLPLTDGKIRNIMERIVEKENLVIDEESKNYLISISSCNIRIMIQHLEKIYILGEPITIEKCRRIFSIISFHKFEVYLENLKGGHLVAAIRNIYDIHDQGYSVIDILDFFFLFLKNTTSIDETVKYKMIPLICKYITIFHKVHEDSIELVLFTNNLAMIFRDLPSSSTTKT